MISLYHGSKFTFSLLIGLFSLGLVSSCNPPPPPQTEATPDARADLVSSLKGANVDGFNFATEEDETQAVVSLTNNAVNKLIKLEKGDSDMVLRYTTIKEKKTNASRTYKTDLIRKGNDVTLQAADIRTGEVVFQQKFIPPKPHQPTDPTFKDLKECIDDFYCHHGGDLLCQANKTCQPQFGWLSCFFADGTGVSVHLIIQPTRPICGLVGFVPNIDGVFLAQ